MKKFEIKQYVEIVVTYIEAQHDGKAKAEQERPP